MENRESSGRKKQDGALILEQERGVDKGSEEKEMVKAAEIRGEGIGSPGRIE